MLTNRTLGRHFQKSESKMLTNRTLGRRELGTLPPPSVHYQPPLESGSSPKEFHLEQLFICLFQIACQNFLMTFEQFLN